MKKFNEFINEYNSELKKFIIENNKFKLFINNTLATETSFNIEEPDEFFNHEYVSIYDLKTYKEYQGKGYAKYLLEQIFIYVKNKLKLNTITLIVNKDNYKAVNLYFNMGFEIFIEYDDSYSLIKKLN
ncbi:MAG: GNAT family N-acetyltransferase [Saccharofermentanales bacterium]